MTKATASRTGSAWKNWAMAMVILALVIGFLFRKSFDERLVLFSNDAPLGLISSKAGVTASTYEGIVSGFWNDLNWVGIEMPSVLPGLSWGMFQLFGTPVVNAKFHTPLSLMYLGFCAWFFFRTLGFRQVVCVLGALAAALNTDPFSHATWGLPSRALTLGSTFLALAALYSGLRGRPLVKAALAGMCVGMGIVEGFDVGALYSLYVAAFGLFLDISHPRAEDAGKTPKLVAVGVARVAVVAIAAGLFSAQALSTLIGTQIKGVEGMEQDTKTKEERWVEATAWSLPKIETMRVLIPGLFGYRMDTPNGGNYWGRVGYMEGGMQRHSGAGEYAGVLVVLIGIWGAANAFRRKGNLYETGERRIVLFWAIAAFVSILFSWGHWAPFYRILYSLPFFSTIRNPIKFMHFFQLGILILFAYGLELIFRRYIDSASEKVGGPRELFKKWWAAASAFERKTVLGFAAGLVASLLGFLIYNSSKANLEKYLANVGFPAPANAEIAAFSFNEYGIYLFFYVLAFAALLLSLCGFFSGSRARWAGVLFGAILLFDLCRANSPWIVYYDYKDKYVSNGIFDFFRSKPNYEQRATFKIAPFSSAHLLSQQLDFMQGVFSEWLQHQFQYFNIQSLDPIQMPRPQLLDVQYRKIFVPNDGDLTKCARLWQLSNTRYIFGQREYLQELNQRFDPSLGRFRIATNFDFAIKPDHPQGAPVGLGDLNWALKPDGKLAIFEFTGALPRFRLFTNWQQVTDDKNALATLISPAFDPAQLLLVHDEAIKTSTSAGTNLGNVTVVSYEPKKIQLKVEAAAPAILLWNDHWSPNWHATVDGQPVKLLRCNYIMRGIQVPAGAHQVEMHYAQPAKMLWISFATLATGVLLCAFLAFEARSKRHG